MLIAGDDQVRFEVVHEPGQCGLGALPEMPGGGGTNFVPLIAAAARHHPDQAVVLTDLQGPAGTAPGFAVLWAVPHALAGVALDVPGRTLAIGPRAAGRTPFFFPGVWGMVDHDPTGGVTTIEVLRAS